MKTRRTSSKSKKIRLPRPDASYAELSDFFDRHDGIELLEQGIMEINPDQRDLERMRLEYLNERNTKQLNIRIPATAKRMIQRLAKRKTVEVSTLVPIFYTFAIIPPAYHALYQCNPIAAVVLACRNILLEAKAPPISLLEKLALVSLGFLAFGFWFFGRLKRRFADYP